MITARSKANVVFRVDGGRSIGMGHVVRCLSLARVLRENHDCVVSFCMNRDEVGISHVERAGFRVERVASDEVSLQSSRMNMGGLVVDLPDAVSAEFVRELRRANPGSVILLLDGTCPGRLEADLVVAPVDRLPDASCWPGFKGERYEGPKYAILDPAYADAPKRLPVAARVPRVLVTMGGSDPYRLTLQAVRALDKMTEPFEIVIALGPAFMHEADLSAWLGTAVHRYEIRRGQSLLEAMVNSDVGVVSFGTTVYELAATGLPSVALSITEDHREAAEIFSRYGSLISLGLFSSVTDAEIRDAVRRLLGDASLWLAMAQAGQATVDGRGAERVAELLLSRIRRQCGSHLEVEVGKSPRA